MLMLCKYAYVAVYLMTFKLVEFSKVRSYSVKSLIRLMLIR